MKNLIKFLVLALMLVVAMPVFAQPASPVVRVGISDLKFQNLKYSQITLYGTSDVFIYDKSQGLLKRLPPYQAKTIKFSNGVFSFDDKTQLVGPLVFDCPNGLMGVSGLTRRGKQALYHGVLELVRYQSSTDKFCLVNMVEVEEYLKGVVPNEMPVRFGLEALKAQAVAARNYVLQPRTRAYKEFDVCDSVASQVYYGANTEDILSTQAVKETEGLVALYNWKLILAQYSSTAGGYTESYSHAFSDPSTREFPSKGQPYLKAQPDMISQTSLKTEEAARKFYTTTPDSYDVRSPYYRWQKEWTGEELEQVLLKTLKAQSPVGFVKPKYDGVKPLGKLKDVKVKQRGDSGKVVEVEVVFENETFHIFKELCVRRVFQKNNISMPSANVVFDVAKNKDGNVEKIIARGGGFGHGVGMSQFGAGFMGSELHMPFDKILKHYYTGISIGTVPVILSNYPTQQVVTQTFYSPYKKAVLVVDNRYGLENFDVVVNGKTLTFPLERGENRLNIVTTKGNNAFTFYYPTQEGDKKGLRVYVEVVEKDKANEYGF